MSAYALSEPLHAAGARAVWWIDSQVDVTLTAAQTEGHAGMWLWHARGGAASPLHVHRREDEQFLVVEGQVRFVVGDQRIDAGSGDAVLLPRDVPHAYLVTSPTARVVGSVTPGGFESFFTRIGAPVVAGQPQGPPPSRESLARASAELGVELLGPPPTLE